MAKQKVFHCDQPLAERIANTAIETGMTQSALMYKAMAAGLDALAQGDTSPICNHCGWQAHLTNCGNCGKPLKQEAA